MLPHCQSTSSSGSVSILVEWYHYWTDSFRQEGRWTFSLATVLLRMRLTSWINAFLLFIPPTMQDSHIRLFLDGGRAYQIHWRTSRPHLGPLFRLWHSLTPDNVIKYLMITRLSIVFINIFVFLEIHILPIQLLSLRELVRMRLTQT
jgi:hypothetical protein